MMIWMYVSSHSISGVQFQDLLILINLHLAYSYPALKSIYMFKKYFSNMSAPIKKHYFCNFCLTAVDENLLKCSNVFCSKDLTCEKSK